MIRTTFAAILVTLLTGCGTFENKAANYRQAAEMAVNPEHIEIHYERDGGTATFRECRCTGAFCEKE